MQTLNKTRYTKLLVGTLAIFFAGILYAWSILKAPLAESFGWTAPQLAFNFTLTLCFFCIGSTLSGLLSAKTSAKIRLMLSALLVFIGFLTVSRLTGGSPILLYLAYGILAGLGIGIAYNTIVAATGAWFPDRSGFCSGILMMSFGFSTLLLGGAAGRMMSSPFGWRNTYVLLSALIGGILFLSSFIISPPPKGTALPAKKASSKTLAQDVSTAEMLRKPSFYILFLFFILLAAVGSTVIGFSRDYFISFGFDAPTAISLVGILSLFNGVGRIVSGTLFDRKGLRLTQVITSLVAIGGPLLSIAAVLTHSPALSIIGLCICGFSYGFSPTLTAAFCAVFYGQKHFPLNFSLLMLPLIPASFVSTLAGALIAGSGSYLTALSLLLALSVLGAFVNRSLSRHL